MKQILITGGTGGIGAKISLFLLQKENCCVKIWATSIEKFNALHSSLPNNLKQFLTFDKVDISNAIHVEEASQKINELDILINAAAVLWPVKPFLETSLNELEKSFKISMWGTVYPCYYLLPLLQKSKKGKIINFSGGGGANGRINHMAYSLAKTTLVRFTENMSLEHPMIDINIVAPGAHKTNIWQDEQHDPIPEKWGNMDDLLKLIVFLANHKSDGITGKFINYKDNWNNMDFIKNMKDDQSFLTLRRIDNFQFTKINKYDKK